MQGFGICKEGGRMKVLLTGNKGYIGRHLEKALWSSGHGVVGLDIAAKGLVGSNLQDDITGFWNFGAVLETLKQVDVVVHCAGSCSVPKSIENPVHDCRVNVLGALNMMETALNAGVKRFVNISSGGALSHGVKSPYGVSKRAVEMYAEYYNRQGMSVVNLRLGNVYGGEGHHGVIANWERAVKESKPLFMAGDGEQCRDFVWYEDVIREIVASVTDWKKYRDTVELGSGDTISLLELKKIFDEVVGRELFVETIYRNPNESDDVLLCGIEGAVKIRDGIERLLNGKGSC